MKQGIFVAAKSSRGHLAHALHVSGVEALKAKWERRGETVAAGYCAAPNVLISEHFDTDAKEHDGHRTCQACVQAVRSHRRLMQVIHEESA